MYRKEIINAFSDAPEAWTAEELRRLADLTGEVITAEDLRTARRAADDIVLRHIAAALAEAAEEIHGATFQARLDLLRLDLLPLLTFKAEQLRRIIDAGTGADLTAEETDGGPPG